MKKTVKKTIDVEVNVCDLCSAQMDTQPAIITIALVNVNCEAYKKAYESCDECFATFNNRLKRFLVDRSGSAGGNGQNVLDELRAMEKQYKQPAIFPKQLSGCHNVDASTWK